MVRQTATSENKQSAQQPMNDEEERKKAESSQTVGVGVTMPTPHLGDWGWSSHAHPCKTVGTELELNLSKGVEDYKTSIPWIWDLHRGSEIAIIGPVPTSALETNQLAYQFWTEIKQDPSAIENFSTDYLDMIVPSIWTLYSNISITPSLSTTATIDSEIKV